jgi:hypothetical protein
MIIAQLVKIFPAFCLTRKFTRPRCWISSSSSSSSSSSALQPWVSLSPLKEIVAVCLNYPTSVAIFYTLVSEHILPLRDIQWDRNPLCSFSNSLLSEFQQLTDCPFSNVCPPCPRIRPPAGKTHVTISLEQLNTCTQLPTAIKQDN